MKVVIDTCVILDVLQKREPFFMEATEIFFAVATKKCEGIITAKAITDIHYLFKREIRDEKSVRFILQVLFSVFKIVDTLSVDCYLATLSEIADYEDAVMVETAKRMGFDGIITRNLKDYRLSPIKIFSPEEFLTLLNEHNRTD
ncbi:MAG: PIN domain-containing protein [Selenomonadaceae bacterium]|nr:PIN domain-containing protein [Selenomonadaceae bacterium]